MAAKKPAAQPTPPPPGMLDKALEWMLDIIQSYAAIGIFLGLSSLFTLLSLVTGSRGALTGAWIDLLRTLMGSGVWLFPFAAGGLGLWMFSDSLRDQKTMPWMRPVGVIVLMLAYVTAMSLLIPYDQRATVASMGEAGGSIGAWVATNLQDVLTIVGAWVTVIFLLVAGIIFLTDSLLFSGTTLLYLQISRWLSLRQYAPLDYDGIDPAVPMPSGVLPWWTQLRDRVRIAFGEQPLPAHHYDEAEVGHFVQPLRDERPAPPRTVITSAAAAAANPANAAQRQATAPLASNDPELLAPRIIGGTQEWRLPKLTDMLGDHERRTESDDRIREQGRLIQETLELFGVPADFEGAYKGPSVTQYLIKPGYLERNIKGEAQRIKVKVAKIASLQNDLALALAAPSVRIEAPIPGTSYVGIEVPNLEKNTVGLKDLMDSEAYKELKGKLKIALGEDVKGQPVCADLARMPHLLIAGSTGSGKSVCVNGIISTLLLTMTPDDLRFLMIDPKMVELSVYNGIPHLLSPVVTEVDKAAQVLFWAVKEMERRYSLCSKVGARDIVRYNEYLAQKGEKKLPYIVVIVDEMADLMMAAPEEVEKHICRLAQMARAIGIHLIVATQRPSVDVITGLIKANFPSRIAFAVTSQTDSRVILDVQGAERLLGRGDMLFMAPDASKLERLQGTWLSDDEINKLVRYWKGVRTLESPPGVPWENIAIDPTTSAETAQPRTGTLPIEQMPPLPLASNYDQPALFEQVKQMKAVDDRDPLYADAVRVVRETGRGSISLLQRELRVGYGRSARLVDQLEAAGILGPDQGGTQGRALLDPGPSGAKPRIIGGDEDESSRTRVWF